MPATLSVIKKKPIVQRINQESTQWDLYGMYQITFADTVCIPPDVWAIFNAGFYTNVPRRACTSIWSNSVNLAAYGMQMLSKSCKHFVIVDLLFVSDLLHNDDGLYSLPKMDSAEVVDKTSNVYKKGKEKERTEHVYIYCTIRNSNINIQYTKWVTSRFQPKRRRPIKYSYSSIPKQLEDHAERTFLLIFMNHTGMNKLVFASQVAQAVLEMPTM